MALGRNAHEVQSVQAAEALDVLRGVRKAVAGVRHKCNNNVPIVLI